MLRKVCPICELEFSAPAALGGILPRMCFDCGEALAAELAERSARDVRMSRMAKSCIPPRYRDTLETITPLNRHQEDAQRAMRILLIGLRPSRSMFLSGGVGTGKTTFACAALRTWIEGGHPGRFTTYSDLLSQLKQTYSSDNADSEADVFARYVRCPFLVVDELGAEKVTEYTVDRLMSLVNTRYNARGRTIWISNLGLGQLAERLSAGSDATEGKRIVSRIYEDSELVQFDGVDLRMEVSK